MEKIKYAQGWDIEEFERLITNDIISDNKIFLRIRLSEIDSDVEKLDKCVKKLCVDIQENKEYIRTYKRTILKLKELKKLIERKFVEV